MELRTCHDLNLPAWGPYTKKYVGISHMTDQKRGMRFDLSVFPGYYRRRVDVPCVTWESGYHPWEASVDLKYFSHRHELEWKDKVYTDISFSWIDDNRRLIRCECINNTDAVQNIVLHFMGYMNFPPIRTYSEERIYPARVELPVGAVWIDAMDYEDMSFAVTRPTDSLVYDGLFRGEIRDNGFVNGSGLGEGFGQYKGDKVSYRFSLQEDIKDCCLLLRYRMKETLPLSLELTGHEGRIINLTGNGEFMVQKIYIGDVCSGERQLTILSNGGSPVEFDGFALAPQGITDEIEFVSETWEPKPEIIKGPVTESIILKYLDTNLYYGLTWEFDDYDIREFNCSELDRFMRHYVHEHVVKVFHADGHNHFTNVFLRPIELEPMSKRVIHAMVCCGTLQEVEQFIASARESDEIKEVYKKEKEKRVAFEVTSEGEGFVFSQEKLAATLLLNVVYPIYAKGEFIRHSTPGKWWDCLYTWDSGFIGLGLLELDEKRAVENLNAYLTSPSDDQTAFLHHGSMVPVQFYLFHEIWNRGCKIEYLEYFYPRLRHYYGFFSGKEGSSSIAGLKSGLLKTWDYFYNSGGWDDYPPQVYVHKNKLEETVSPVITTIHCIRAAKILMMAATALGLDEDVGKYKADIERLSQIVQEYCWDKESGYFGYVVHDMEGNPLHIMRHESGQNFNMGLDGIYPIIGGICNEEQERAIMEKLTSDKHLWTDVGITTVDKTAAYYRMDGYWNGAVWMAHQWFIWKTMLDLGQPEFAFKIAITALEAWKRETDDSYNCMEHFIVKSGRGAGWHQFGGLSSPVLNWLASYYVTGVLTTGFNVWVENKVFSKDNTELTAEMSVFCKQDSGVNIIVNMNPQYDYVVLWNDREQFYSEPVKGSLQVRIEAADGSYGILTIARK